MDFKTLGNSLMSTFAEDKLIEHFDRMQLKEAMEPSFSDLSSVSLVTHNPTTKSSSTMGRNQILEICVDSVKLTDTTLKAVNGRYSKCLGIRICWHFMNYESTTPIIQVRQSEVKINDIQNYMITLNDVFSNYILKRNIRFELYATYETREKRLGCCETEMKELIRPEKNIRKQLEIISPNKTKFFKKCQSNKNNVVGTMFLRYILKASDLTETPQKVGNIELKELFHKINKKVSSETLDVIDLESPEFDKQPIKSFASESVNFRKNIVKETAKRLKISVSDYSFVYDILDKILYKIEYSKLGQTEQKEKRHQDEINLERTLEEYAILSGMNPKNFNIDFNKSVKVRSYDQNYNYESVIVINVISLYMQENKYPLPKNEVKELYIEYSFLSRNGKDMETLSLPLLENRTIEYNFKRTFFIDTVQNHRDCKTLAKMIKEKKHLQFMVIEEPIEDLNKFQICKEIGFAQVNLFDLIETEDNCITDLYPIMNINNPNEKIGYLKISLQGIQAMRNVALKLLTPHGYVIK